MDERNIQENIRQFWIQHKIHDQSVSQNKCYPKVTIYDGPPFPTGPPHHGHMMTSAVKDTVTRYLMATGHYVPRQLGWDMHGPNNPTFEKMEDYITEWNKTLTHLGRWIDGEGYRTSSPEYIESAWWVFKTLWNKGYLRIGYGLTPYCQSCNLYYSDFERYQQYCSVTEQTIYYKVPTSQSSEGPDGHIKSLIVWEMWPWTLMAVTGYAIGSLDAYVIDNKGTMMSREYAAEHAIIIEPVKKEWIVGLCALNPITDKYVPVTINEMITPKKGTGVVRLAPTMDARLGSEPGLGQLTSRLPELVSSEYVITLLEKKDLLHSKRLLKRNDSACPKCNHRLITYPCYGIYYNIKDNRGPLQATLESIYWEPKSSKERILQYLQNADDWLISRSSPVGIPIPIWQSESGKHLIIGSYSELKEYGIDPLIIQQASQGLPIDHMGEQYQLCHYRFDNWFDSACMPYASVGYPFRTTNMQSLFPCLLAIEGVDQIYGWFFTTNVISHSLYGGPAFKNIITNGLVLHEGVKMSKSKMESRPLVISEIDKYGADTYRVYLMQNRLLSGIDFNYDQRPAGINNHFTRGIINVYHLIQKYASPSWPASIKFRPTRITNITDNWILQSMDDYLEQYHELMSVFKVARALGLSTTFLNSIRKYVNFNHNRLNNEPVAVSVIIRVFYHYLLTVAPFTPHIAEYLFQQLRTNRWIDDKAGQSVHLCQIPRKQWRINKEFLRSSDFMFRIIDLIHKTPLNTKRIKVYLHDITLVHGVDSYISEVTGKDIIYRPELPVKAYVIIQHHKAFIQADLDFLENMSLEQIIQLDEQGYYRNVQGNRIYPGQYVIKYEPMIDAPQNYCSCGVLIQIADQEQSNLGKARARSVNDEPETSRSMTGTSLDSKEIIIKGQIIGRRLDRQLKKSGRSIIYVEHPALSQITDERAKVLVSNINRYTLPIIKQSIYQYRGDIPAGFISLDISVFSTILMFHFVPVDKIQGLGST
jgi:isoleucyl-tRNA synthetase